MKKVLCLIIVMMCFLFTGCSKSEGTIEEITGVSFNKINYIKANGSLYNVEEFISEYKGLNYKKISEKAGSTRHFYYVCYDSNDKILFTLVDIGNQNKYYIKKGKFDINKDALNSLYQLISK